MGEGLETWINNARVNSCETATALVSSAAEAMGYDSPEVLREARHADGARSGYRRRHAALLHRTAPASWLRPAAADPNIRAQAPFVGNFTWKALKNIDTLDDAAGRWS